MQIEDRSAPSLGRDSGAGNDLAAWFLLAVVCGLAWRLVRFALHFELTGDECGIMRSVIERSYAGLLEPLSYSNVSPPMFLWLTKFVDSVFRSEWAVRLIPLLAGFGAVAVFGLICRDALEGAGRWVAWAVFCVSYVPVTEGTRVKGYTIDLFVATLMLWWTMRWLLNGRHARYLAWLAVCAPVFVWLSYTAVFIVGGVGIALAACALKARGDHEKLGRGNVLAGLAFAGLAGVSVILLYELNVRLGLQASVGNGLADGWKRGYPPLDQPWTVPMWLLSAHTGRGFAWPIGENHFGSTLTFVLWAAGLAVWWRRGNRWLWALFAAPQALSLAAAFLHKYPYLQNPRISMFLGPGICVFAGAGAQYLIDTFGGVRSGALYRLTAVALAFCALAGIGRDVAMRVREIRGPGIRSALAEAGELIGPDGQFVELNDGSASGVFTYYMERGVKQKVWRFGEGPQIAPGAKVALVAAATGGASVDADGLFAAFERRIGRPLKTTWSEMAREVLLDSKDTVVVRVCAP